MADGPLRGGQPGGGSVFRGYSQHSIDGKGRTSLPAEYRAILTASGENSMFLVQAPGRVLWAFAPTQWLPFEQKIMAQSQFTAKGRDAADAFLSGARECPIDGSGRILLPSEQRDYAGLNEAALVFAGAGDRIKLWNVERWKKRQEEITSLQDSGAFDQLGALGI